MYKITLTDHESGWPEVVRFYIDIYVRVSFCGHNFDIFLAGS